MTDSGPAQVQSSKTAELTAFFSCPQPLTVAIGTNRIHFGDLMSPGTQLSHLVEPLGIVYIFKPKILAFALCVNSLICFFYGYIILLTFKLH